MGNNYLTFDELRRANRDWLGKEQNRRFHAMMRHSYYNHEFIRTLCKERNLDWMDFEERDDWEKKIMPLLRKVDYIKNPQVFVLNPQQDWNT
ncbi:MAG: hypothetical protein ACE5R6_08805 [Candidatus Heimdallarchaeota archaeon]